MAISTACSQHLLRNVNDACSLEVCCLRVRVRVRACGSACACMRVPACACVRVRACARVFMLVREGHI